MYLFNRLWREELLLAGCDLPWRTWCISSRPQRSLIRLFSGGLIVETLPSSDLPENCGTNGGAGKLESCFGYQMTVTVRRLCPDRISQACDCSSFANLHYCVTLSSGGGGGGVSHLPPDQAAKLTQSSVLDLQSWRFIIHFQHLLLPELMAVRVGGGWGCGWGRFLLS